MVEEYCMVVHGNFQVLRKYLEGNLQPRKRSLGNDADSA